MGRPYDPTQVPNGTPGAGFKMGLLAAYFTATNIFKCPEEPNWQCSYGMNYSSGSPMGQPDSLIQRSSEILVIWDHQRSPGCSDSRVLEPPRPPWVPFDNPSHYPPRHNRRLNGLFHDAHAVPLRLADLRVRNFREAGNWPLVSGYPGE